MSARPPMVLALLAALALARPVLAQRDSAAATPDGCGAPALGARLQLGAGGDSAMARRAAPLDTVITLAITDRTWTRSDVQAGVALSAGGARWHACAGATARLGTVTAHLHNVHGIIRLHADLADLDAAGHAPDDAARPTPPRGTPPAVPPRR